MKVRNSRDGYHYNRSGWAKVMLCPRVASIMNRVCRSSVLVEQGDVEIVEELCWIIRSASVLSGRCTRTITTDCGLGRLVHL